MPKYETPTPASREDVANALTSSDPVGEVKAELDSLERLEDWVLAEKSKWAHALSLVEMYDDNENPQLQQVDKGSADTNAVEDRAEEGADQPEVDDEAAANARPTRREGVLTIMRSEPNRSWKLAEIIAELKRRQWATGSQHEDAMVLKTLGLLKKKNIVRRPRTGYYRLVVQSAATEPESQVTLEDA